ncbi:MAG: porin [Alphaproteobacteria bacterium]|nr:porin [Alphaproteobacteria bacterium]OJV47085.1 MAG: hypothetical protein BGO28_01400 [Alphaproteobacteria bacterium 43-37]
MKKVLLGGTAAFGLLLASHAMSQDAAPKSTAAKLTISGSTSFHVSAFSQDAHTAGGSAQGFANSVDPVGKGQGYNFSQDDSNLDFTFSGSTDSGIDYLGRINFTGQSGSSTVANNYSVRSRVRQNYVQLSAWGATIQGGALWGVETTTISDGSAVMRGDGGFGSNWSSRFNEPFNTSGSTGNMLYGAYLAGTSNTGNKINLITPTVFGFHLSASLTPNTSHTGDMYHNNNSNTQGKQANFNAGTDTGISGSWATPYFDVGHQAYAISYNDHFGQFNVALSAATVLSNDTRTSTPTASTDLASTYNKTKGYYVGGLFSAYGFDLGLGFYDNKNTGVTIADSNNGRNGGKVWNVGLGWSMDQWALAVGYLNGKRNNGKKNDFLDVNTQSKADIYSLTADMKLADGLTVYGDLNYAKMTDGSVRDAANGTAKATNKGTVFLLGTRVNF